MSIGLRESELKTKPRGCHDRGGQEEHVKTKCLDDDLTNCRPHGQSRESCDTKHPDAFI